MPVSTASPSQITPKEKLKSICSLLGLTYTAIEAKGNCQFLAIADQLITTKFKVDHLTSENTTSADLAKTLRSMAVEYMQKNKAQFFPFIPSPNIGELPDQKETCTNYDAYLEEMKKDGTWGDHLTMKALSNLLGVNILTINTGIAQSTNVTMLIQRVNDPKKNLIIGYTDGNHYESLRRSDRHLPRQRNLQKWIDQSDKDSEVIEYNHFNQFIAKISALPATKKIPVPTTPPPLNEKNSRWARIYAHEDTHTPTPLFDNNNTVLLINFTCKEKKQLSQLNQDALDNLKPLNLRAPSGLKYQLSIGETGLPTSVLTQDSFNEFADDTPSQKKTRAALGVMHLVDVTLSHCTVVQLTTKDPLLAAVIELYTQHLDAIGVTNSFSLDNEKPLTISPRIRNEAEKIFGKLKDTITVDKLEKAAWYQDAMQLRGKKPVSEVEAHDDSSAIQIIPKGCK